jgi:hypothetical protein
MMTTYVKTLAKGTRYPVTGIENGVLVGRQKSGKRVYLALKDVGRPRYDAAVQHFYSEQQAANAAAEKAARETAA